MLCVVKNISLNGFLLSHLPSVSAKDVLVLSCGAVKCVDMNEELRGNSDIFSRLTALSRDKGITVLLHSDFCAAGGIFNSAAVMDGEICGVSDEINPLTFPGRSAALLQHFARQDRHIAGRGHRLSRTLGAACHMRARSRLLLCRKLSRGTIFLSSRAVRLRRMRNNSRTLRLLFKRRNAAQKLL